MKCQACNFDENQTAPRESWNKSLLGLLLKTIYRREPYRPIEQHEILFYVLPSLQKLTQIVCTMI